MGGITADAWDKAAQLVLSELKRLDEGVRTLDTKLDAAKDNQSRFEARVEVEMAKAMAIAKDLGRLEAKIDQAEKGIRDKTVRLFQRVENLETKAAAGKAYVAGAIATTSVLWAVFLFWLEKLR